MCQPSPPQQLRSQPLNVQLTTTKIAYAIKERITDYVSNASDENTQGIFGNDCQLANPAPDLQTKLATFESFTNDICAVCHTVIGRSYVFNFAPPIISFDVETCPCIPNSIIQIAGRLYALSGIIYFGNDHFTCRIIHEGNV